MFVIMWSYFLGVVVVVFIYVLLLFKMVVYVCMCQYVHTRRRDLRICAVQSHAMTCVP